MKRAAKRRLTRPAGRKKSAAKWSAGVMQRSDALDLERGIFKQRSAVGIARSLKKSAEASRRRVLNQAKTELRKAFGRPPSRVPR